MATSDNSPKLEPVEEEIKDMKIKSGNSSDSEAGDTMVAGVAVKQVSGNYPISVKTERASRSVSPLKRSQSPASLDAADDGQQVVGGEVTVKQEPGRPPKLERKASKKVVARPPPLFDHYENKTDEAQSTFEVMESCSYFPKSLGDTEPAMDCDCAEEWDAETKTNLACGDDSDCVNRVCKMECVGDCGCGEKCQNMRFQGRQYADIAIIKTEKKGYGVRANRNLEPNQFIFEYIGEVINEKQFRTRMLRYDDEGIKHFYFMSLNKGEFVDATKKGNLGRFCNHSCNPNCYVDKWIVGSKQRMGIFAERAIKAGEELVFNYNVDRYGADPQPCYCGEPNCTGFIGGKTQTDRATKLSNATLEALGIDDGDGWETTVAKRSRKKKASEDDEEYVDSLQPRSLDEDGVTKVMASLMQCKEKWIAVKLLGRVQRCEDTKVRNRVVRMHGYQILKTVLNEFKDDTNVVLQILDILDAFPRSTRNKIADSKIEDVISTFTQHEDERVADMAQRLLTEWAALEIAYRIPRIKRDPETIKRRQQERLEREGRERRRQRSRSRTRSRSPPIDAPKGPAISAPTGPRAQFNQFSRPFPRFPKAPPGPLPEGWFMARSDRGTYYYTSDGRTSWTRPPAPPPPLARRRPAQGESDLDKLINDITSQKKEADAKASAAATPQSADKGSKDQDESRKPKWMSYTEDQQKRLYKTTLMPHVSRVANKHKKEVPKDELKRLVSELLKGIADYEFKKSRVKDPTLLDDKQAKKVRNDAGEFFKKAVKKWQEREKKRKAAKQASADKAIAEGRAVSTPDEQTPVKNGSERPEKDESDVEDVVMNMSEDEDMKEMVSNGMTPATPLDQLNGDTLKRKRKLDPDENGGGTSALTSPHKRARSATPPPPPPPPPPAEDRPESADSTPIMNTPGDGWQSLPERGNPTTNGTHHDQPPNGKAHVDGQGSPVPEEQSDYGEDYPPDMSQIVQT